MSCKLAFILNV